MNAKPKLLYASPLPPQRSGVSYYSVNLIQSLREAYDITLLTEDLQPSDHPLCEELPTLDYRRDTVNWDSYDFRIFNIGNNPSCHAYIYEAALRNPGLIILHDAVLYFLTMGYYMDRPEFYERIYQIGGPSVVASIRAMKKAGRHLLTFDRPNEHPLNAELVNSGNAFVTHSDYARQKLLAAARKPVPVQKINFIRPIPSTAARRSRCELFAVAGIPEEATLITSIGFIAPTKQNQEVCRAINRLNEASPQKLHYVMVGEGTICDQYRNQYIRATGFVDENTFQDYLFHSDLVINLRYPSMGETSAALLDAMSHGKPCVVSDDAWFAELPDDVVLKVPTCPEDAVEDVLFDLLTLFQGERAAFRELGAAAAAHVREEHSAGKVVADLGAFLNSLGGRGAFGPTARLGGPSFPE